MPFAWTAIGVLDILAGNQVSGHTLVRYSVPCIKYFADRPLDQEAEPLLL